MSKEYVCGLTARKKLRCDKAKFQRLVDTGAIEADRAENGSWRVSKVSLEEYLIANTPDPITILENENKLLKEKLEYYEKILRDVKRSIPKEI